jgi:hypothetical protein
MNYIKAIRDTIKADAILWPLVWDRVDFLRNGMEDERSWDPFIVFTEWTFANDRDGFVGLWWPDHFPIIFDVIVRYKDAIIGRQIRSRLVEIFNGFHGELTPDFRWNIGWIRHSELLYNPKTEQISYQSEYIFKTKIG